jgi:hypothetical protein
MTSGLIAKMLVDKMLGAFGSASFNSSETFNDSGGQNSTFEQQQQRDPVNVRDLH